MKNDDSRVKLMRGPTFTRTMLSRNGCYRNRLSRQAAVVLYPAQANMVGRKGLSPCAHTNSPLIGGARASDQNSPPHETQVGIELRLADRSGTNVPIHVVWWHKVLIMRDDAIGDCWLPTTSFSICAVNSPLAH